MLRPFLTLMVVLRTVRSETPTPIVQTDSGPIRGVEETFEGATYIAFKGIPYAAPPVGDLRFKPPQPPEKWTDVRDGSKYGVMCPQMRRLDEETSEDCLTLNVYTPTDDFTNLKPVLVGIPGIFFRGARSSLLEPQFLGKEDIVVVTINYRVGPLGFLATNTPDATGNWGLKDQVAALKWVQANIAQFGGDPKQVTLYGQSAGAACVHLHLFSPLSQGLFEKVIISSGSATNFWTLHDPEQQVRFSKATALNLGASEDTADDPKRRVQFLREADWRNLTYEGHHLINRNDSPFFATLPFAPVIEAPGTEGAFLTEDPNKLLSQGNFHKVPMMVGITDLEASLFIFGIGTRNITNPVMRDIEADVCQILPQPLKAAVIAKNECAYVAKEIGETYFDGKGFEHSEWGIIRLWGDIYIAKDVYLAMKTHAKYADDKNPVYSDYFTFDGEWGLLKEFHQIHFNFTGAGHGDDARYIFLKNEPHYRGKFTDTSPEAITRSRMLSFLTNFVKSGDPTPSVSDLVPVKWLPAVANDIQSMVIDNELKMEKDILKARMDMWGRLNEKYLSYDEKKV